MPIIVKVANTITYSIIPHLLLSKPRGPKVRDCFGSAVSGSADTDAPNDHNGIPAHGPRPSGVRVDLSDDSSFLSLFAAPRSLLVSWFPLGPNVGGRSALWLHVYWLLLHQYCFSAELRPSESWPIGDSFSPKT